MPCSANLVFQLLSLIRPINLVLVAVSPPIPHPTALLVKWGLHAAPKHAQSQSLYTYTQNLAPVPRFSSFSCISGIHSRACMEFSAQVAGSGTSLDIIAGYSCPTTVLYVCSNAPCRLTHRPPAAKTVIHPFGDKQAYQPSHQVRRCQNARGVMERWITVLCRNVLSFLFIRDTEISADSNSNSLRMQIQGYPQLATQRVLAHRNTLGKRNDL